MTWPHAQIEALRLVEELTATYGAPRVIELYIYSTEALYRQEKPMEEWPWAFHTQVVRATYRELLKRGFHARLVKRGER